MGEGGEVVGQCTLTPTVPTNFVQDCSSVVLNIFQVDLSSVFALYIIVVDNFLLSSTVATH